MAENLSAIIIFSIVFFSLGAATLYRSIIAWLRSQSASNPPPLHASPSVVLQAQKLPWQRVLRQGCNLLGLVSFALITGSVLAVLLGYLPLSF